MTSIKLIRCICSILLVLILTTACTVSNYSNNNRNGFLSDYTNLEASSTSSGSLSWQWHDKTVSFKDYRALKIEQLTFYPLPQSNDQVSQELLEDIRKSTDTFLRETAQAQGVPLTTVHGKQVLVLRSAITSAKVKLKGLSLTELIPIRLAFSGIELALGKRDRDFELLFEYELIDSITKKVVFRGIKYSPDILLENDKDNVTPKDSKLLLEKIISYLDKNFKTLSLQLAR